MGLYAARDGVAVLRGANESGLWQAWRAEDGTRVIQALDVRRKPWGNFFSLSADDFFHALNALPAGNADAVQRYFLRADSPHLLEAWFDQALAAHGDETALGLLPEEAEVLPFAEVFGVAPSAGWPGPQAGVSEGLPAGSERISVADPDFPPAACTEVDPSPPEASLSAAERIVQLERLMRVRFADLLVQLDDPGQASTEEDLQRLLQEEADFSWQQKYMFTEFGVALRRKGKKRLALMAHLRAYALAQEDGHILFNLARGEYELGRIAEARSYLARVLTVLPNFAPALNFLAFLEDREHS
jgi:tetratricopeptide (TPR) repeat protein